jgi:thiol-disulfide isomerase/thioredoxin
MQLLRPITMPEPPNDQDGLIQRPRSQQLNTRRRGVTLGLLASFFAIAAGKRTFGRNSEIPSFRSGRFQFTILEPRRNLSSVMLFPFRGKAVDLLSFRGKPILLNFWATWCEACQMEMPILDRLQEQYRHSGLENLAVSEDKAEGAVVARFINKLHIRNLKIYLDPNGYVAFHDVDNKRNAPFALYGMPITYAIAGSGWVVGYMPGAADWSSAAAGNLIELLRRS